MIDIRFVDTAVVFCMIGYLSALYPQSECRSFQPLLEQPPPIPRRAAIPNL